MANTKKCKTDGCLKSGLPQYKGLCILCYSSAKKLVDSGAETWDSLAALGLTDAEPSRFERAYLKRKEGR